MIADELQALDDRRHIAVLIQAAREGRITALTCAMEVCKCPEGRTYFEPRGRRRKWAPSVDRYPIAGIHGGEYVTSNVRLAHAHCNQSAGQAMTAAIRRANGSYQTEAARELAQKIGKEHGSPALRRWQKTPEGQARMRENGRRLGLLPHRTGPQNKSAAELAKAHLHFAEWAKTPESRAHYVTSGKRMSCKRWNVARGKPCVCGHHVMHAP